jgi:hypothetical protein
MNAADDFPPLPPECRDAFSASIDTGVREVRGGLKLDVRIDELRDEIQVAAGDRLIPPSHFPPTSVRSIDPGSSVAHPLR